MEGLELSEFDKNRLQRALGSEIFDYLIPIINFCIYEKLLELARLAVFYKKIKNFKSIFPKEINHYVQIEGSLGYFMILYVCICMKIILS